MRNFYLYQNEVFLNFDLTLSLLITLTWCFHSLLLRYSVKGKETRIVSHMYGGTEVTCVCFYLSRAHDILSRAQEILSRAHEIIKSCARDK